MSHFTFPKDFLWGAATSSHQVEGNNTNNDWWEWEQQGKVKEKSLLACDQWELYEKDFDLAKSLSHNAHRFSVEWSRIEPKEGEWDEAAIAHYRHIIVSLRERGIEPIVTLHHFTNPLWFARKGGWERPESVDEFTRYVRYLVGELGSLVRYWITINEPMVFMYKGYIKGEWPPGEKSIPKAIKVIRYLIYAHVHAYQVIHEEANRQKVEARVSLAHHFLSFAPCHSKDLRDHFSAWMRDRLFNFSLLDALSKGWFFFPGVFAEKLPIKKTLDYIGLNYYTRDFVEYIGIGVPQVFGHLCTLTHYRREYSRNQMKWEIYPQGLYQFLKRLKRYQLPILITENGICTREDTQRETFILDHIKSVVRALQENIPVIGYLYWALLDNFEWAEGYSPRFGLIEVDYATQRRKIRPSALRMAELIRKGVMR